MDNTQRLGDAKDQLNLVLGFFPRVDAKASAVLGIDTAMLALLGITAPPLRALEWNMLFAVVPVNLLFASLVVLYMQLFPHLSGGRQSLIYFREIASRTESNFIEEFSKLQEDAYIKDLLSQTWRNAEILKKKFDYLRTACILLGAAFVPWLIALAMFAAKNTELKALIGK
jgi:hypothetical protein